MSPRRAGHVPKLCLHKAKELGYVTLPGTKTPHYFVGRWPSGQRMPPADVDRQYRLWLGEHCRAELAAPPRPKKVILKIMDLALAYLKHCKNYYVKHGRRTSEAGTIEQAVKPLLALHATLPVEEFGPLKLKAVRAKFLEGDYARDHINKQVNRIRAMFKWGVSEELVPETVWRALQSVSGLPLGRYGVREEEDVQAVPLEAVEAALLPLVLYRPAVAAMAQTQLLIGCRPTEVCVMRPRDVDRSGDSGLWLYTVPPIHDKTEHHDDGPNEYWIGPRAQNVLAWWLERATGPDAWVFPMRHARAHARSGKSRLRYTRDTYRLAVKRALERFKMPTWSPLQLRHAAGQEARDRHEKGIQATQARLGHKEVSTSQIYASEQTALAQDVARRLG